MLGLLSLNDCPSSAGYAAVTTTIRLRFDGRSTAYQRSLRSQWRNPLAAVTLTYLFIQAAVQQPGRNAGRRMVVEQSNCSRAGVASCSLKYKEFPR